MATRKERDDEEKKPKAELPDPPERPESDEPAVVEVDLAEPEPDDEIEVDEPEPRQTAQDKRRKRGSSYREAQEKVAALEAENNRMKADYAAWQQNVQAQQVHQHTQHQVGQAEARYRDDLKTFYGALEGARRADGSLPPEQAQDFERRAMELKEREFQIMSAKYGAGQQQVNPQQIAAYVEGEQLKTKYADVLANPAARSWGEGRLYQLASERGITAQNVTKAQYYELLEEAAEETRHRFGLGSRRRAPAPDAVTRARFSGVPSRSNGGGDGTIRVSMGRDQKRMAHARYPELAEADAEKKWANGPGKRATLAMQRKSG